MVKVGGRLKGRDGDKGDGGECRMGTLERSPEDFTIEHFILAKNHTGSPIVFFFCVEP